MGCEQTDWELDEPWTWSISLHCFYFYGYLNSDLCCFTCALTSKQKSFRYSHSIDTALLAPGILTDCTVSLWQTGSIHSSMEWITHIRFGDLHELSNSNVSAWERACSTSTEPLDDTGTFTAYTAVAFWV